MRIEERMIDYAQKWYAENVNTDRPATEVTYNPYKYETFVDKHTESFVYYADEVLLSHNQVTAYIS